MRTKQKKFVEEIIKGKSGKDAVINAGYNVKNDNTAYAIASENLRKPKIEAEIDKRIAKIELKTDVTVQEIVNELSSIAFSTNPLISKSDKLRALELLGKYKAMFTDKLMTDNTTTYNIPDNDKQILEDTSRELAIKLSKTA